MVQSLNSAFRILFNSPELLDIQRAGFQRFLKQGIAEELTKKFPIKVKSGNTTLELVFHEQNFKLLSPDDNPRDCILKTKTYSSKLYAQVKVIFYNVNASKGQREGKAFSNCLCAEGTKSDFKEIRYQTEPEWVLLGHLPMMTERGHFVINGSPRVIVHQIVRSPGIYFQKLAKKDEKNRARFYGDIIPLKGVWVRLQMTKKGRVELRFKKGKKVQADLLQKCLEVIEFQSLLKTKSCPFTLGGFVPSKRQQSHASNTDIRFVNNITSFDKRKIDLESKTEHDAFVSTYDKLYRTAEDKELELGVKKRKLLYLENQSFSTLQKANFNSAYIARLACKKPSDARTSKSIAYMSYALLPKKQDFKLKNKSCCLHGRQHMLRLVMQREGKAFSIMPFGQRIEKALPSLCGIKKHVQNKVLQHQPKQNFSAMPCHVSKRQEEARYARGAPTYKSSICTQVQGKENAFVQAPSVLEPLRSIKSSICHSISTQSDVFNAKDQNLFINFRFVGSSSPSYKSKICDTYVPYFEHQKHHHHSKSFRLARLKNQSRFTKLGFVRKDSGLLRTKPGFVNRDNLFKRKKCSENLVSTFKLESRYSLGKLGRNKINAKFGLFKTEKQLSSLDIHAASNWLNKLRKGEKSVDDIDHSQNRRIRTSGELLQAQFENGVDRLKNVLALKLKEWSSALDSSNQPFQLDANLQLFDARYFIPVFKFSTFNPTSNEIRNLKSDGIKAVEKATLTLTKRRLMPCDDMLCLKEARRGKKRQEEARRGKSASYVQIEKAKAFSICTHDIQSKFCPICNVFRTKQRHKRAKHKVKQVFIKLGFNSCGVNKARLCKTPRGIKLKIVLTDRKIGDAKKRLRLLNYALWLIVPKKQKSIIKKHQLDHALIFPIRIDSARKQKNLLACKYNLLPRFICSKQTASRLKDSQIVSKQSSEGSIKELFSTKPINGALREFFGSNPLSQYMDQTNPLAELTHKRRLSSLGLGGVSRESAGMAIRGIHSTHYGRICPIETPEGKNAGLVNSLAFYSGVDQNGFLKTPYYQVFKGQVQSELGFTFCGAKEESLTNLHIAPSDLQQSCHNILRPDTLSLMPCHASSYKSKQMPCNANAPKGQSTCNYGLPVRALRSGKELQIKDLMLRKSKAKAFSFCTQKEVRRGLQNEVLLTNEFESNALSLMHVRANRRGIKLRFVGPVGASRASTYKSKICKQSNSLISRTKNRVPVRLADDLLDVFKKIDPSQVDCIGISPVQMISVATSLIPFLEHNDANRALMGSNMQRQAVPLMISERPIVGTGLESLVLVESGHITQSQVSGFVSYVSAKKIVVESLSNWPYPERINGQRVTNRRLNAMPCLCLPLLASFCPYGAWHGIAKKSKKGPTKRSLMPLRGNGKAFSIKRCPMDKNAKACKTVHGTQGHKGVKSYKASLLVRHTPCKSIMPSIFVKSFINTDKTLLQNKALYELLLTKSSYNKKTDRKLSSIQKHSQFTQRVHSLNTFRRSNQNTCITEKPLVRESDWVQKGDVLTDCSASENGELAVGKNLLIAYIPWEGYNFEDAIVISERLVKEHIYTSLHIERYIFQAQDLKDGNEWFTRDLPGVSNTQTSHLKQSGLPKIGRLLKEGDILVGKIRYLNKKPASSYERLLCDILGEKNFRARNQSLYVPKGVEARVINHRTISFFQGESENKTRPAGTAKTVHVFLGEKRVIQVGDKMSGRHGNKGVISTILPRQDMPYLPDGTPIDLVLNPLGVPSRMNVGQTLECLLGLAASYSLQHFKITSFDELYGIEASQSLVYLKLYQARLQSQQAWLFQVDFPGKVRLIDGRSGECFDQWITVGRAYILKLIHMVTEKIHARGTGPYALITQQPLRGRSNKGGQRLGEMEVWAFEGFGAAYTLQELLTKKSDDFWGRKQIVDSILPVPSSIKDLLKPHLRVQESKPVLGQPEIFKVLLCELQALCLDVGVYILTPQSLERTFLAVIN